MDRLLGRAFVREVFDFVVRDQVYLCEKAAGMLGQEGGLLRGVIDARQQDIFEKNLFLFGADKNITGLKKTIEGVTFVDRHNFIPDGVAGGVKGEGETELERMVGELLDLRC